MFKNLLTKDDDKTDIYVLYMCLCYICYSFKTKKLSDRINLKD